MGIEPTTKPKLSLTILFKQNKTSFNNKLIVNLINKCAILKWPPASSLSVLDHFLQTPHLHTETSNSDLCFFELRA